MLWFPKNNRENKPPTVCQPASSTNGIGIDPAGNLWVPDGRADTTTEIPPNCGAAKLTIPDPTGEPADVGFDSKGNVYVMNLHNTSGPPTVGIYNSSGVETGTLTDPSFELPFGVGTDSHDNVYVSNLTSNNVGNIVEFPGGAMPGTVLGLTLGLPGSPVFDSKDNLIITDWLQLTLNVSRRLTMGRRRPRRSRVLRSGVRSARLRNGYSAATPTMGRSTSRLPRRPLSLQLYRGTLCQRAGDGRRARPRRGVLTPEG